MALSFAFDASRGETPETLARRRAIAEAIAARNGRAPKDVGEGLTSIGNAIAYRMMMSKADKAQAAGLASANEAFAPFASGFGAPDGDAPMDIRPDAGGDATAAPMSLTGDIGDYANAIAGIESGGKYDALGPETNGDRAYGKYQVMGANIPSWTQEALGREMTPQEFVADPAAQDAVFQHRFGGYVTKYGSPEEAASMWFTGRPIMEGGAGAKDILGTTGSRYVEMFDRNLGQRPPRYNPSNLGFGAPPPAAAPPQPPVQVASLDPTAGIAQSAGAPSAVPPQAEAVPGSVQRVAQAVAQRQGPTAADAMRVLSNPFSNPGQQAIAKAILEQEMQRSDPMRQLQMQEEQLKIDALRNPKQDPFTLSPGQSRYDASGKPIASVPDVPKPPQLDELFDQETGLPYKARWNPETGQYERVGGVKAPSGTTFSVDPESGEVNFSQGNVKPLTQTQSKDVVYVTRATGTLPLIDKFGDTLTSLRQNVAGGVPLIGNYMKTPEYQQAEQAGKEFLQAILRKDTGAAITQEETDEYGSVYLPRPGDSPQVLAQKKASRARAIIAIQNGLPASAMLQLEKAGTPTLSPDAALVPSGNPAKRTVDPAKAADILKQAQDAIKAGADPEAVRKRALEMGVEIQGQ